VFLKSLEIFGFKSFAERSLIEFADGVTALLGPNGCGKSNVVDAIKWVLGEQATKTLRAESMEDVIFNGTETRRALNVAEVSLTLANDNGILSLDMPEVVVKRRLYRSGESEYYINSTPVKLKDIRELFFDTGIGKSAYSIMEQGKIDQVLSNKPEERRHLFEEAASITKYKIRGQEAERKLEKTDENMRQVDSILGEVKRSYDNLKKQADKTVRYRSIRDEMFDLELRLQLYKLRETQLERDKREKVLLELKTERDSLKQKIDSVNVNLEENIDEVSSLESQLLNAQKNLYALELDRNNHDNQIRLFQERVQEVISKVAADRTRDEAHERKFDAIKLSHQEREKTIIDLVQGVAAMELNIARHEDGIEQSRAVIASNEKTMARLEQSIESSESTRDGLQEQLQELTDRIVHQLDASLHDSSWNGTERQRNRELIQHELNSLRILLEGRTALVKDAGKSGAASVERAVEAVLQAIEDVGTGLARIDQAITDWEALIPTFIDEMLAPEGTLTQKRELDEKLRALREAITENRRQIVQLRDENEILNKKIVEARDALEEMRVSRVRLAAQKQALEDQNTRSLQEMHEIAEQRNELQKTMAEDLGRIQGLEQKIASMKDERTMLETREKELRVKLAELEHGIVTRNKTLESKEKELKLHMALLGQHQEKVEKAQITLAEVLAEIKNINANFREKHARDLQEFQDRLDNDQSDPKELRENLAALREEQKTLGSVNLMALEEFTEVKERFEFLKGQIDDLRKAKADLETVTAEIRNESSQLFTETYEKIKKNFHNLFRRLFGGGKAELRLSDPENVLESGIEIYAQPPGKKQENISLLSGGEKSLTAVALLFATYMVKPSPFCLLDEIDAALDESNVGRFVNMLMEFAHTSQFIVITHNKKTVTGAKTLLGVTMEELGVSKIVSIRLSDEVVQAVAAARELQHGGE